MTINIGIIGAGWRAEFFLRVAQALPNHFHISRMLVRNPNKAAEVEATWQVPTVQTLETLLQDADLDYVILSVPRAVSPELLYELTDRQMPVLAETPPGPDLESLLRLHELTQKGAKIQVAEQYQFQPAHAARLALARSGKLGTINQAQVSVAHGYHGINLLRGLLNVGFDECKIRAHVFESPIIGGPGRHGPPSEETIHASKQTIAYLDFGDKMGVFDFVGDMYFSWIRSQRILVRGERGEINNTTVRYLKDFRTPLKQNLCRLNAGEDGNLEGYYFKGILLGDEWLVNNPFAPARLTDDELAIAHCMQKMADYINGGPSFCSLSEASQDHYLGLMIDRAAESGEAVRCAKQAWAQ